MFLGSFVKTDGKYNGLLPRKDQFNGGAVYFPSLSCEPINLQQAGEMQLAVNRAIVGAVPALGKLLRQGSLDGSGDERKPVSFSCGGTFTLRTKEWLCIVREGGQEKEGNEREPLD